MNGCWISGHLNVNVFFVLRCEQMLEFREGMCSCSVNDINGMELLREAQGRWGRGGGRGGAGITTSVVDATATTLRVYARTGYYVLNHGAFPGKYLVLQCHSMFLVSLFFQAYVSGDVPFFLHGCSMRFVISVLPKAQEVATVCVLVLLFRWMLNAFRTCFQRLLLQHRHIQTLRHQYLARHSPQECNSRDLPTERLLRRCC